MTSYVIIGILVIIILAIYYSQRERKEQLDKEYDADLLRLHPTIGFQGRWLAWLRALTQSILQSKRWSIKGHFKYSKAGIPFIIPSIERGIAVIIPPQQLRSVYNLPENVLNVHAAQDQTLQVGWTIWNKKITDFRFHISVIRHQLTRNLDQLTPLIAAELEKGFERWWGTDPEWKEINIWDSCFKLVAGASNRAFCGIPICRDVVFLKRLRDHAMSVFLGGAFINATPKCIRPAAGVLTGLTCRFLFKRASWRCLPIVKERLEKTEKLRSDPDYSWTPPRDGLQWIIEEAYANGDKSQLDPDITCKRLLLINDISLHTTSFTVHNLILDLVSSDPSKQYIQTLRAECEQVLRESGGSWTLEAVNKLRLVDSAIRESIRVTPITSIGLPRTVVHPDGIELKNSGVRIPCGTTIATAIEAIHYDEDIYTDARRFDPFRFAQPQAAKNMFDTLDEKLAVDEEPQNKPMLSASLDEAFLGFGFGKHACPGRFFALNEMKIFVANMLINYDLEPLKGKRPELIDFLWLKLPFHGGKVRVRRRQVAAPKGVSEISF